ncbi:MAG: tetratricopeptide repeat protein [Bacteroidales bacterium]|nr:tetratricopeptide repeat protein [Bacteroidales bacterium]
MAKKKPAKPIPTEIPAAEKQRKSLGDLWFKVSLFAFAFILYGNTLKNGYSLDDLYVTYNNPVVKQGIKAIPRIFTSLYINVNAEAGGSMNFGYRPVAKAMFAVEHEIFGENPGPSHLINVILYGLNILLLFIVLRKILWRYSPWFSFIVCLLWAAHPLHTEVVASLKNREEILSFSFVLLSILSFLRYTKKPSFWLIPAGAFLFLLSLISKPGTLPFIVAIPLILYFFTDAKAKTLIWTTVSLLAIFYISLQIVKYSMPFVNRPVLFIENPLLFEKNFFLKISTGFYVLLFYLKMLVFPHPLVFYYGYNMIPVVGFSNPWVILSILIHIGLFAYAIWKIKEKHILSFAILFYLVTISMYANFVKQPTGIVAERFLYMASLSFCIALTYFIFKLLKYPMEKPLASRNAMILLGITALLLIPATAKTIVRNQDWKSEISLYSHDLKYLDKSAKAHYIYANALKSNMIERIKNSGQQTGYESEINQIYELLNKTVAIYPGYFEAWNTLGEMSSMMNKDYSKSLEYFSKAAEVKPKYAPAWFNMGYAHQQLGQFAEAIPCYRKAFEIDTTDVKALSNLGACYSKVDKVDSAIYVNKKILEIKPKMKLPYLNIISYYMQHKDTANAVPWLEQIDMLHPGDRRIASVLYKYYLGKGNKEKTEYYKQILISSQQAQQQNSEQNKTQADEPQKPF